jgi:ubiquitin-activating enzyme E1
MAAAGEAMEIQIDEDRESRQVAVYGRAAMRKLMQSKVLISGMNGLGAEVAKNVILGNAKQVVLHDDKAVSMMDLSAHFYLTPEDVGANRATACLKRLQELNPGTDVQALEGALSDETLSTFDVVVCIDTTLAEAIRVNQFCHAHQPPIHFIRADVFGLFGTVFNDAGPESFVNDIDGEPATSAIIEKIERGTPCEVTCIFEEDGRHNLEDGDPVRFTEVEGMTELNQGEYKVKVHNPYKFEIPDTADMSEYTRGGIVHQVKPTATPKFKTLAESLSDPSPVGVNPEEFSTFRARGYPTAFLDMDYGKFGRPQLLHLAFRALDAFRSAHNGSFPALSSPWDVECSDVKEMVATVTELNSGLSDESKVEVDADLIAKLAHGARAVINPMAAMFGGIVGQEVIKAVTSKYHPLQQWLHFDSVESLQADPIQPEDYELADCRYDSMIAVFGRSFVEKLKGMNYFLVGAGALGCEFMKNFAMIGVACGTGKVTLTDDDVIERSNLSRQFLFRNWHVKAPKSTTAAQAAKEMNPDFNVEPLQERVSPDTEDLFNDEFWNSLSGVCNALDNVKARLYVDQRCVHFEKSLLESGTLGTKCNVQVVIPHETENYGASIDPPEKEAPQCTVHNFPHNIDHTLVWARSEFVGSFESFPSETAKFLEKGADFVSAMQSAGQTEQDILQVLRGDFVWGGGIKDYVSAESCTRTYAECIQWAMNKFMVLNNHMLKQLIHNFPEDAKNSKTGKPFWSPPKRFPTPLEFDPADPLHMDFLIAATNLRATVNGINPPEGVDPRDPAYFREAVAGVQIREWAPKEGVAIQSDPDEQVSQNCSDTVESVLAQLPSPESLVASGLKITPEEFEKDDDTNFHMAFIHSLANLRARSYGIPEIDFLQSKLKAGRIIPAIATTTAMVTGLVMLEMLKLANGKKLEDYRNSFINLALPQGSMSEPMPPAKTKTRTEKKAPDPINHPDYVVEETIKAYPEGWTVWDKFTIDEGDLTVQELLDVMLEKHKLTVQTIVINAKIVYNSFMPSSKARLPLKLSELAQNQGGLKLEGHNSFAPIISFADDEGDLEVETPDITYKFR